MQGVEARTCSTVEAICERLRGTSAGAFEPGSDDLTEVAIDFTLGLNSRIARIAGNRERWYRCARGTVTITQSRSEEASDAHRQPWSRSVAGSGNGAGERSGQAESERRARASGGQRGGASRGHSGGRQTIHFLHLAGHTEKARALSAANGEGNGGDARLSA